MSLIGFNASEIDTTDTRAELPRDWYRCIIDEVEEKLNSKGTGRLLTIFFQIMNGPFEDRKIYHNINYEHISEAAQKIGQTQLAQLMEACGIEILQSSEGRDFLNKVVDVRAYTNTKDNKIEVVGVRKPEGLNAPPVARPAPQSKKADDSFDDDIPF